MMNKLILEECKTSLGISEIKIFQGKIDCNSFLELGEEFLLKEKTCSPELTEKLFDQILEVVAENEEDSYTNEEIQFYNLIKTFCESPQKKKEEVVEKRLNRNLSRIAKRRGVRYRQKYLRALKGAQESFQDKQCQKNIKTLLKKEPYSRDDVYTLIKAMNSSLTHYVIHNEISEKSQGESLPSELLEELTELNFNLFKESLVLLESKEVQEFNPTMKDLVIFANEVFCETTTRELF